MGKYKIPALIWIVFGLVISIYSKIVDFNSNNPVMNIFFYIGLFFLVIGIFKIVFSYINSSNNVNKKSFESANEQSISKKTGLSIVRCPKCNARNYNTYNYCHNCGFKLR